MFLLAALLFISIDLLDTSRRTNSFFDPGKSYHSNAMDHGGFPEVTTLDNPKIPQKVIEASKKKLRIGIEFFDDFHQSSIMLPRTSGGTGFGVRDKNGNKIILTAKHVVFDNITRTEPPLGSIVETSQDGINFFGNYRYKAYAFYDGKIYDLAQIGIGRAHTEEDFIAFHVIGGDSKIPTLYLQENVTLLEKVYMAGFAPIPAIINREVLIDMIDEPLEGSLSAIIKSEPSDMLRLKKLFRVRGSLEPGFSGGPAYNSSGEIIGMATSISPMFNYVYETPAEVLQQFVASLKIKKIK